jgi:dienelactone hydrolase
MQDHIRESVLDSVNDGALAGVCTIPARPRADWSALILNAGVLHRVGPHRLHVNLARRLAGDGWRCARIDLSGIGDSRGLPGGMSFRDSAVADTRATLDALAVDGWGARFLVFGVCSGADNAIATALVDPRVAAIVVVDPPGFPTLRSRLRHAAARLRRGGLLAALGRRLRGRGGGPVAAEAGPRPAAPVSQAEFGAQLRTLADRGLRMLFVYTDAMRTRYNHADQLFEWYPFLRGRAQTAYFPGANHTFTERAHQAALLDRVAQWCASLDAPRG